jgi:hypothetical protein
MADQQQRRYGQKTTLIPPQPNPPSDTLRTAPPPSTNATIGKPIPTLTNDMGRYPGRGFRPQNVW